MYICWCVFCVQVCMYIYNTISFKLLFLNKTNEKQTKKTKNLNYFWLCVFWILCRKNFFIHLHFSQRQKKRARLWKLATFPFFAGLFSGIFSIFFFSSFLSKKHGHKKNEEPLVCSWIWNWYNNLSFINSSFCKGKE